MTLAGQRYIPDDERPVRGRCSTEGGHGGEMTRVMVGVPGWMMRWVPVRGASVEGIG